MIYGLYQSAAGMMTNEYRQNVLANNIANAETVGFKRDVATFAERLRASEAGRRVGPTDELREGFTGGVWLGKTYTDYSEASFKQTDNPLDLALAGPGFFRVEKDGQQLLTRDGQMVINADGWLVSATDGAAILGAGGGRIRLNPNGDLNSVFIDEDGRITQDGGLAGRIGVVIVDNYDALRKVGASRFEAPERSRLTPAPAEVRSRVTESAGVEPVRELVNMMEASRAYQLNAQMVTMQDQSAGRLISEISR